MCLTTETFAEMIHLVYVTVRMTSGNLLRAYGAQSCHLMRIDILMWSSLVKYLVLSQLLLKKVCLPPFTSCGYISLIPNLFENVYFYNYFDFCGVCADLQQWRLVCLAFGFVLLLLAPIISSWVPFYYSSSMAIGVFLVVIILLFQVLNYHFDIFLYQWKYFVNLWPGSFSFLGKWCQTSYYSYQFFF